MAQAMKTIGAVLNEASDANMRDMENNRRAALTNVQIKGQVADQKYQEETRGRERDYLAKLRDIYDEEMFVKKPVQAQPSGAIPTPDADGNFPTQQFTKEAIDPSSRQGMEAISRVQMRSVALRQQLGLAKPEEVQGLVDFRRKMEAYGVADDFKRAFSGDPDAVKRIAEQFKLEGLQSVQSGQDQHGFLNIFAVSAKPDGTKSRVPIGHLAAAFSPEIDAMIKGSREAIKAGDDVKNNASDRLYKDRMGTAALQNAETNSSKAAKSTAAYQQYTVFKDAQKAEEYVVPGFSTSLPGEQPKPIEDTTGRRLVDRLGRIFIEENEMTGGSAHNLAVGTLGEANADATREFNRYRAEIQNAYRIASSGKPVRLSNGAIVKPDDDVAMKNLKDEFFSLEDPAAAAGLWQQGRDQIMEAKIAELTGSKKAAIQK